MALRLVGAVLVVVLAVLQGTEAWNDFCQISQIVGDWTVRRDQNVEDDFKHCRSAGSNTLTHRVTLSYPNIARDEYGNYGTWTTIYGISIEITVHGRKYFSYFEWDFSWRTGWRVDCSVLEVGSSRDILTNNYACFEARKSSRIVNETQPKRDDPPTSPYPPTFRRDDPPIPTDVPTEEERRSRRVEIDYDLVDSINKNDIRLWEATVYDHLQDMTEDDLIMMAGGNMSTRGRPAKPAPMTKDQLLKLEHFPRSFDWRNVDGENYVSPVRSQGYCGSCYAFAALAMYESRIRIISKNTLQPILSPQDIVDCNPYSYGCYGGWIFPEGRFAEEFGFVDETCNSYNAENTWTCNRDKNCQKYFATDYQYVGGYFGASNEYEMMSAILNNGPVVVGYAIYHDFIYYRRGVYYHSGPDYLLGYHAVAVVGWGKDDRSGTKYWIVKNSWGKRWGEDGYFRIIRGNNDCDIEGEAFEAFPII